MVEQQQASSKSARKSSSSTAAAVTKKKQSQLKPAPEKQKQPPESPSYRLALKSLFSCRNSHAAADRSRSSSSSKKPQQQLELGCSSAPSICKQVVNKDSGEEQKPPATDEATAAKRRASVSGGSERCVKKPLSEVSSSNNKLLLQRGGGGGSSSSSSSTGGGSFRAGMQLRRLSGCYECHMVVDPIFRDSSSMRAATICPCPDCGEIFVRQESLQLHQSIRHAVSELGSDDTSRNIIEIIFQSSWLKKQSPVCRIERILKVHNTQRTLARFEEYRDAVKARAKASRKKHPRCTADGNELLRFHCAALGCSLGLNGATHLCGACTTCAIIRNGFVMVKPTTSVSTDNGIRTMATSGRAHDAAAMSEEDDERSSRAMLVCRVIAGRVKRPSLNQPHEEEQEQEQVQAAAAAVAEEEDDDEEEEYESVAGSAGVYSNMEELQVFNPRAILPCFVVIYKAP